MPFLTGLATIALAPLWAAQSLNFPTNAKFDALSWAGLAALAAVATVLGRIVHRAASAKRRRRTDARLAALADPHRRWLASSAALHPAPQPAAPEPIPQFPLRLLRQPATPDPAPNAEQAAPAAPAKPANSQSDLHEPEGDLHDKPIPQDLPPTREQLFTRAMRVPVTLVFPPEHVQQARLAGLMAPPLVVAPEAAQAPPATPEPAAQAMPISAPEAVQAPPTAPEPVPQDLPPTRSPLYAELRAPVMPVPLPKHVVEARLAGLMAPPLAAPEPAPQVPAQPKPAYVPATATFNGGHVLASGLDVRVFLRYRDAAGAVTDSIFQIYQVRASWPQGIIEQLHGYCFTAGACRIIPMRDVQALGDERTGNIIFDLDAFLLGTPVRPNPFGIALSPRGEYIRDPDVSLVRPPAAWLERQNAANGERTISAGPQVRATRRRDPADAGARLRFLLRYVGSDARASDRIVRLTSISLSDDNAILFLNAHCERAGATRMFRRDRIAGLGDAMTGAPHADIDEVLRQSGAPMRRAVAMTANADATVEPSTSPGSLTALEEARQMFAAMAPAERLASATRPADPAPPKEKRPRGRPRKNPTQPKK